jgi:hypothetical protein
MELCNENTGRKVLPFNGMTAADAYLWTRNRQDDVLQQKFIALTDKQYDDKLGYYGKIGDRTVIKNCKIIKDVWIGPDAYLKGANKIKNVTINSDPKAKTQIGEGCELVNGIIGYGCRVFYGIKAVRFILSDYSQLKYGARLINSFLGPNATISCCEVLNSLIFPAHEQHHNNSFLCAALVMGQSNIAAGATLGSNHNSRGADGEVIMGRGFWPGLCVSIKHNSIFASFALLNKGDYAYELNIPIPFSLISNDTKNDELVIMPGYWFLYNFYALARNAWKYIDRDKRIDKTPIIEFDYLAPDSVNELISSLDIMAAAVAKAQLTKEKKKAEIETQSLIEIGRKILATKSKKEIDALDIFVEGFENSKRKTRLVKVYDAYHIFEKMIFVYGMDALVKELQNKSSKNIIASVQAMKPNSKEMAWTNVGGQLMPNKTVQNLLTQIKNDSLESWDDVHAFYAATSAKYPQQKAAHALACLELITKEKLSAIKVKTLKEFFEKYIAIKSDITKSILHARSKDYKNPFRKMVYENEAEMNKVIGSLDKNSFIIEQNNMLEELILTMEGFNASLKTK